MRNFSVAYAENDEFCFIFRSPGTKMFVGIRHQCDSVLFLIYDETLEVTKLPSIVECENRKITA